VFVSALPSPGARPHCCAPPDSACCPAAGLQLCSCSQREVWCQGVPGFNKSKQKVLHLCQSNSRHKKNSLTAALWRGIWGFCWMSSST